MTHTNCQQPWKVAANIQNKQERTADKRAYFQLSSWARGQQILTVQALHFTKWNREHRIWADPYRRIWFRAGTGDGFL